MPNDSGNNTTNNNENKFPNQGNFSASQNNIGKNIKTGNSDLDSLKNIATNSINNTKNANNNPNQEQKMTDDPQGLKDNIKKEGTKKALEMAANAYAGPAGGELAKAVMNSKLGNKAMNALTNLNKSPLERMGDFFNKKAEAGLDNSQDEGSEGGSEPSKEAESTTFIPKEVTDKVVPGAIFASLGCLGSIVFLAIIASVILSPIMYIGNVINKVVDGVSGWWNGVVNWFQGCESDEECQAKEEQSFYKKLDEVHTEYQQKYGITLNTELITATLTYYDPMAAFENMVDSDSQSSMVDFKKSEKKIRDLAEHMKGNGKKCVDSLGNVLAHYKEEDADKPCPDPNPSYYYATTEDEKADKKTQNKVSKENWYYLDEEKYRKYLENEFIRKFYFDNKQTEEVNKKIPIVIRDIYDRVEMVNYLNGSGNTSSSFIANNAQVVITDCTGNIELEQISLYEYLQGILYLEGYATNRSEEFLKVMAVAAKNYLYAVNGATPDSIPTSFRVRSCQMNQVYCSVEKGCHNMNDGEESSYDKWDTIASGPDSSGAFFRPPITDVATLEKIKRAIDSTLTEFIIKDGKFVTTQYRSSCSTIVCDSTTNIMDQKVANEMIESGSTYKEVLAYFYGGTIEEVTLGVAGYPLDLVNNNVTSAFGWRVHPIHGYCRTHGGTDIAAPADANIYAIADGVVVNNYYSSSYGNVTILGHGGSSGSYQYYSLYAHQIRLSTHISIGQEVKAGQVIGNVGSTGDSTGNHLHIEIYTMQGNTKLRQDPVAYFVGVQLKGQVGGALYGSEAECLRCVNTYGAGSC